MEPGPDSDIKIKQCRTARATRVAAMKLHDLPMIEISVELGKTRPPKDRCLSLQHRAVSLVCTELSQSDVSKKNDL